MTGKLKDQEFVWVEYFGYVIKYTDNGGVGIAKERDMAVEIWLPDTAIEEIDYHDGTDNNIETNRFFSQMKVESVMARRKGLVETCSGD